MENKALVVGKIMKIYEKGMFNDVASVLVLLKPLEVRGKVNYSLVLLPDCEKTYEYIGKNVYVEGSLKTSYMFNDNEKKYVFVEPSIIEEVDDNYKIPEEGEFYKDYTRYNRVILEGEIISDLIYKYIKDRKYGMTRFKLRLLEGSDSVNCIVWDMVPYKVKKGDRIKIVGSMVVLSKRIINSVDEREENEQTSYLIIVQKINNLKDPNEIASTIYK